MNNQNIINQDHELTIFTKAMEVLIQSSKLEFNPWLQETRYLKSVGIDGHGNMDSFEKIAGVLTSQGYETKTGKRITGNNLRQMKSILMERYGKDFLEEYIDWSDFGLAQKTNTYYMQSWWEHTIDTLPN